MEHKISDLKIGDAIGIYINRVEGGITMGPSLEGKQEYYTLVAFGGTVYNNNTGQAYFTDTMEPLGLPLHDSNIHEVKPGAALSVIKQIMLKQAHQIGKWAISQYYEQFGSFPVQKGDKVRINTSGGEYSYQSINRKLNIRNNHKILNSKNLEFVDFIDGEITVRCIDSDSIARTGMQAIDKVLE